MIFSKVVPFIEKQNFKRGITTDGPETEMLPAVGKCAPVQKTLSERSQDKSYCLFLVPQISA